MKYKKIMENEFKNYRRKSGMAKLGGMGGFLGSERVAGVSRLWARIRNNAHGYEG